MLHLISKHKYSMEIEGGAICKGEGDLVRRGQEGWERIVGWMSKKTHNYMHENAKGSPWFLMLT